MEFKMAEVFKKSRSKVVRNTMSGDAERLPSFAITREQYLKYGGMPTQLTGSGTLSPIYAQAREALMERGIDPFAEENEALCDAVEGHIADIIYDGESDDMHPLWVIDDYYHEEELSTDIDN